VVRRSKLHGDQLIRAGAGRWNAKAEALFFAALERTACVESAAAACGFSTNALYKRREAYPEFAGAWDMALDRGRARIPDLLGAATLASLDPGAPPPPRGLRRLPKVNVDQAIRISKMHAPSAGRRKPADPRDHQRREAERHAALTVKLRKLIAVVRARRRKAKLAEGWSEVDGLLIPPGWLPGEP